MDAFQEPDTRDVHPSIKPGHPAYSWPQVKTARNIFALPLLEPESEAWFAQNLDDFLAAYDWTVPMAMPLMESVALRKPMTGWFSWYARWRLVPAR